MRTISQPRSKNEEMKSSFYIHDECHPVLNEAPSMVLVEVVFGMPAKDCLYHGICKIEPADTPQAESRFGPAKPSLFTKTEVSVSSTGQLVFRFYRNTMPKGKARRHFGSGFFIVLEPVEIPNWISIALNIQPFNISTGLYEVVEEEAWYKVAFSQ